jgi:hypothetical protein
VERDQTRQQGDDMRALWRHVGELIGGQTRHDSRFDRVDARLDRIEGDVGVLKADMTVLKADVAELKTDVAETKDRLGRLERSSERRFNRVDAQLERLIALVQRAEVKQS